MLSDDGGRSSTVGLVERGRWLTCCGVRLTEVLAGVTASLNWALDCPYVLITFDEDNSEERNSSSRLVHGT